ncbi:tyrosine-type recombinase/integrase [Lentisphaerota bacterium WC36G]|nr:site-specific integrase [Lentisphaerae bacterium WC36]
MAKTKPLKENELILTLNKFKDKGRDSLMYCALGATMTALGARIEEALQLKRGAFLDKDGNFRNKVKRPILKKRRNQNVEIDFYSEIWGQFIKPWLDFQRREYGSFRSESYIFCYQFNRAPLHRTTAWKNFNKIYKELKLEYSHGNHGFRKAFGVMNFNYWVDFYNGDTLKAARQVQKLFKHGTLETTLAYLDLDNDNPQDSLKDAFNFLIEGQQY